MSGATGNVWTGYGECMSYVNDVRRKWDRDGGEVEASRWELEGWVGGWGVRNALGWGTGDAADVRV
jgi:hypothetical protein